MKKVIFVMLAAFGTGDTLADSVMDMCSASEKVCSCAAMQLKADVTEEDYALYQTIGATYLKNKSAGMAMGDAWDTAVTVESKQRGATFIDTLNQTNGIGQVHNKAMRTCMGL